jgi:hypothetical protein
LPRLREDDRLALFDVTDDRGNLVLQLRPRDDSLALATRRVDNLAVPPFDQPPRDRRPLLWGHKSQVASDQFFNLADGRAVLLDKCPAKEVEPFRSGEREKGLPAIGVVRIRQRFAQLCSGRGRIDHALRLLSHRSNQPFAFSIQRG